MVSRRLITLIVFAAVATAKPAAASASEDDFCPMLQRMVAAATDDVPFETLDPSLRLFWDGERTPTPVLPGFDDCSGIYYDAGGQYRYNCTHVLSPAEVPADVFRTLVQKGKLCLGDTPPVMKDDSIVFDLTTARVTLGLGKTLDGRWLSTSYVNIAAARTEMTRAREHRGGEADEQSKR